MRRDVAEQCSTKAMVARLGGGSSSDKLASSSCTLESLIGQFNIEHGEHKAICNALKQLSAEEKEDQFLISFISYLCNNGSDPSALQLKTINVLMTELHTFTTFKLRDFALLDKKMRGRLERTFQEHDGKLRYSLTCCVSLGLTLHEIMTQELFYPSNVWNRPSIWVTEGIQEKAAYLNLSIKDFWALPPHRFKECLFSSKQVITVSGGPSMKMM